MYLFLFNLAIILIVSLILFSTKTPDIVTSNGYLLNNPNPFYFSGNKSLKRKKHNMLRISRQRRK